jgi:hypothetical protein
MDMPWTTAQTNLAIVTVMVSGVHTVGGVDGDPGIRVTGWSREHGDLRVPHFVGLHAIQALALVAVGLRRWRRPEAARIRALLAAAASYAALFLLLLWQALRGQSLVAPDWATLAAIGIWAVATTADLCELGYNRPIRRSATPCRG